MISCRKGFFDDSTDWLIYSAIHKAIGSLVTGHSQKYRRQERPPEAIPPLKASWMEQWNGGIVLGKAGNHEAGGFVNSTVMPVFEDLLAPLNMFMRVSSEI